MSIQVNEQTIDWQKWLSLEIKDPALFRDNLLEQKMYSKRFDTFVRLCCTKI